MHRSAGMDLTLEHDELELICEGLQTLERELDGQPDEERLKAARKLFQRLHTLRTAK